MGHGRTCRGHIQPIIGLLTHNMTKGTPFGVPFVIYRHAYNIQKNINYAKIIKTEEKNKDINA